MPDPPEHRVLPGRPTVRTPEGERVLDEGDIVAFPAGRPGAQCAYNDSKEPVRYLTLSTMSAPTSWHIPTQARSA
jgi:uncharacterized cupin superfamily protein